MIHNKDEIEAQGWFHVYAHVYAALLPETPHQVKKDAANAADTAVEMFRERQQRKPHTVKDNES